MTTGGCLGELIGKRLGQGYPPQWGSPVVVIERDQDNPHRVWPADNHTEVAAGQSFNPGRVGPDVDTTVAGLEPHWGGPADAPRQGEPATRAAQG